MEKLYITENISVFRGNEAEVQLKNNNDLKYINQIEKGVHKVDETRWEMAQSYERKTWMVDNLNASDDRNYEHLIRFDNYNSINHLLGKKTSIIELGCGPFTNLRFILPKLNVNTITLVDPLIDDYISHPNCYYKTKKINNIDVTTINSPIEKLNINEEYDIVLMINVLEHCYDIDIIFKQIDKILKKDGVFIFSDVYFNDVENLIKNQYDAGHPLRLSTHKLSNILDNFSPIYDDRLTGLYSQEWRNDIYFIGTKK